MMPLAWPRLVGTMRKPACLRLISCWLSVHRSIKSSKHNNHYGSLLASSYQLLAQKIHVLHWHKLDFWCDFGVGSVVGLLHVGCQWTNELAALGSYRRMERTRFCGILGHTDF